MPTVLEQTTETKAKVEWAIDASNPPGPLQFKAFKSARQKIANEHQTHVEKYGIIGFDEHESVLYTVCGVNHRPEVTEALERVGTAFDWKISRKNVGAIVAALEAEIPALIESRPVEDHRRTKAEVDEQAAQNRERERQRQEEHDAKEIRANALAAKLREKYPWAIESKNGSPARAAANCKIELAHVFPGHTFSVRSDYNSISVRWSLGPTEDEVKKTTEKYKSGQWDSMTDYMDHDRSDYGAAVDLVLGRATRVEYSRDYDNSAVTLLLTPMLCELEGMPYDPTKEPWQITVGVDNRDCPEAASSAIRQILYHQSFPPYAQITGLEVNPEDGIGATGDGWERYYRATFTVTKDEVPAPGPDAPAVTQDGPAAVRFNAEHNGIEIRFPSKPSASVMDQLRERRNGFHWSPRQKIWYAKASRAAAEFACRLAGSTDETKRQLLASMDGAADTAGIRGMEDANGING